MKVPEVRYARSGELNIAYQTVGEGPLDVVFVMGWVSNAELFWQCCLITILAHEHSRKRLKRTVA